MTPLRGANAVRRAPTIAGDDAWIARYMPIPFVEHGRSFRGCDCRGQHYLILEHELGVRVPEPADLYRGVDRRDAEDIAAFVRAQASLWRRVEPDDNGYPRFALLLFLVAGLPTHVGTSLGGRRFIHTQKGCGARTASLDEAEPGEAFWGSRLEGAYVYGG